VQVEVTHDPESGRFTAAVDGVTAGRLRYREDDVGGWIMYSTVVDPDYGGQGVGTELVRVAVESARRQDRSINATCWFVAEWLERNPAVG